MGGSSLPLAVDRRLHDRCGAAGARGRPTPPVCDFPTAQRRQLLCYGPEQTGQPLADDALALFLVRISVGG